MIKIHAITVLVADYDEAINFYVDKLGFSLEEDVILTSHQIASDDNNSDGYPPKHGHAPKRWVRVRPDGETSTSIILAKPSTPEQATLIGKQGADRVMFFLSTDDFDEEYQRMMQAGVVFLETPRQEDYGKVAVFEDLYGNRWDLISHR